jgi:hypothetical protein
LTLAFTRSTCRDAWDPSLTILRILVSTARHAAAAQTVNSGPPRTSTQATFFSTSSTNEPESVGASNEFLNNDPLAAPGREFRDIIDHHRQLVANDNDGDHEHSLSQHSNPENITQKSFRFHVKRMGR